MSVEPAEAAGAGTRWGRAVGSVPALVMLSLMTLLPAIEVGARHFRWIPSVPGSPIYVQHLTLWIGLLGGVMAARKGRLLALSASTLLPPVWRGPAAALAAAALASVASALAWASWQFAVSEREAGSELVPGLPKWYALLAMPVGFALIALWAVWRPGAGWWGRAFAALGLAAPVVLGRAAPESFGVFPLALTLLGLATVAGLPIFAVFGGFAMVLFWHAATPIASVPVEMYRLVASPLLPSIPLFTFAGYIMVEGGATRRLLRLFEALFGWAPGGLAIVTVVICAIFTWGGSGLTILSLGGLMVPVLIKARYPEKFSIGLLTASGSLGLLFPPSLPVILYGVYAQTPIDRLFLGGLVPGMLMVALVAAYGIRQGVQSQAARETFRAREAMAALWEAKWELLLPAIMLIGLFGGFGTLTEAAALTALAAVVVEAGLYRGMSLKRDFPRVTVECATVVGGILLIIGVALGFTNYLVDAQIPSRLVDWVKLHVHSRVLFLLALNAALLVVGSLMDIFAAILVIVPLLKPLTVVYGIDPVQMGVIFLANLELGYLMPPVGINLCLSAYRFEKPMIAVYRALLPFLLVLLSGVLLITYVPEITLALPRWLGK